jgi:hypothetical protein
MNKGSPKAATKRGDKDIKTVNRVKKKRYLNIFNLSLGPSHSEDFLFPSR